MTQAGFELARLEAGLDLEPLASTSFSFLLGPGPSHPAHGMYLSLCLSSGSSRGVEETCVTYRWDASAPALSSCSKNKGPGE